MKVLTGGKFNTVHEGHIYLLKKCKEMGFLVVVLANDANNRRQYALSAEKRRKVLESTGLVDKIVVGDTKNFSKVIEEEKPDVIVLGYDQELPGNTKSITDKMKIKIVRLQKHGNHCTGKDI